MRYLIAVIFILTSFTSFASDKVRPYNAEKISPSTYVITGPRGRPSVENQGFMNNPAFIVTQDGVIVIDPGSSVQAGRMVLDQIKKVTVLPVTHVLNTHAHGDHWLGNHAISEIYPDARFMGHPQMIKKAHDSEADNWLRFMSQVTEGFTDGTVAVIPTMAINGSDVVNINGISLRIYAPGKAHSGNDIMIEFVEESVVFTGDNVLYTRIARMDDGTFKGNINACDVAISIGAKHYVPGHGPSGGIEIPQVYKSYLTTLHTLVAKLYEEGMEDYEMKHEVVNALKEYQDWVNFEDEVGKHISLALLEIEKSAF